MGKMSNPVPDQAQVVGDTLRAWARERPKQDFVTCGDSRLSYTQADELSDRVAAGLQRLGVSRGHQIAFLLNNRMEFVVLFLACSKIGAVQIPLNPFLRG